MVAQRKLGSLDRKIIRHLVPILALLMAWAVSSCSRTLSGRILDSSGQLLDAQNGVVHLSSLGPIGQKTFSLSLPIAKNGTFFADADLEDGDYFVEALVPGFKISTLRFYLKDSAYIDLKLKAINEGKSITGPIHASKSAYHKGHAGQVNLNPPDH